MEESVTNNSSSTGTSTTTTSGGLPSEGPSFYSPKSHSSRFTASGADPENCFDLEVDQAYHIEPSVFTEEDDDDDEDDKSSKDGAARQTNEDDEASENSYDSECSYQDNGDEYEEYDMSIDDEDEEYEPYDSEAESDDAKSSDRVVLILTTMKLQR